MKKILYIILLSLLCVSCASQNTEKIEEVVSELPPRVDNERVIESVSSADPIDAWGVSSEKYEETTGNNPTVLPTNL